MDLRQNILATLVYYDIFDFPLKAEEIFDCLINFKHLGMNPLLTTHYSLLTVTQELDQLILDRAVGLREGYYFLFDCEYVVPLRIKRERIANRKWRIARRAVWWMRILPYVRAVFASGSLAMRNTDELSDLDILIVIKHGRIWLTRLLITGLLSLLRVCRHGRDKIAPDKICLNHYITDQSLHISYRSIYTAQTYNNLVPIFVSDWRFIDDFKKTNTWVQDYVCRWNIECTDSVEVSVEVKPQQRKRQKENTSILAKIGEVFLNSRLGNWLEKLARDYQSRRIASNPVTGQAGGRVIFNDEQLEFHPHSIETQIINDYNSRLEKLNLPQLAVEKDSGLTP